MRERFRIYVLGGSTAQGEPYAPLADVGRILSYLFDGHIGGRKIAVENRGMPGWSAADVLRDIPEVTKARAGAAVALLYLGNNEFLPYDAPHDLVPGSRPLFDRPTVDAATRRQVLDTYRSSISAILAKLRNARIPAFASTAAVNLSDWEPNRSVLGDPSNSRTVSAFLADGDEQCGRSHAAGALESYLKIVAIEPGFALAWKRVGDCYRALGEVDRARDAYQSAVDCDGNPYRETSEQNAILREACGAAGATVVEAVDALTDASDTHLIGYDYMWDNCHPTFDGYVRVARAFADAVASQFNIDRVRSEASTAEIERALGIDAAARAHVLVSRGQYCYRAATLVHDPRPRLNRSEYYLDRAAAHDSESVELMCSYAVLAALRGDPETSRSYWRQAFQRDQMFARTRASHPQVARILEWSGVGDVCKAVPAD